VRDPFPGNRIPRDQWSAISRFIVDELPHPDPELPRFLDNYPGLGGQPKLDVNNFGTKLTHVLTDRHKLSGFFNWNRRPRLLSPTAYLPAPGSPSSTWRVQQVGGYIVRLSEDWTIGNDKFNHVVVGYNRFENPNRSAVANEGWAEAIGLGGVTDSHFPQIDFDGEDILGGGIAQRGASLNDFTVNESYIVSDTFTWLRGRHTIQFGGEIRRYRLNQRTQNNTSGTFAFGPAQTALPGFDLQTGFSFGSFLLGAVDNASRNIITTSPGFRQWYVASFVQDDWKPTPRLTVNVGLRWEIPAAIIEAHNRLSGLDPALANPGADGVPGALVFLEDLGRSSFQETYYQQIGPRVGVAYGMTEKLILRGGYGLTFGAPVLNFETPSIDGFNAGQTFVSGTAASGVPQDPVLYWDAGYPAFGETLPNKDPALRNGQGIQFTPSDSTEQSRTHNWNIGFQYELPWRSVLEIAYVGNKGENLWFEDAGRLNQNRPEVLAMGDTLREPLSDQVPKPYPSFSGTVAQALRPFPQYTGVGTFLAKGGRSRYDSLQVTVTKRVSDGFSFLTAYTWSKALTNTDTQLDATAVNVYDLDAEYSVAAFNLPHSLKLTWVYDLPFGRGRRFLDRGGVLDALVGGWTITGVHHYRSGSPLGVGSGINTSTTMYGGGIRPDVVSGAEIVVDEGGVDFENGTRYLNPDAFEMPPLSATGVPLRLGTGPRFLEDVRGPGRASEDFGVQKRFLLAAGVSVDVRLDAFNIFNRAGRGNPVTDFTSPNFGLITGPAYGPRQLQLMARVNF
jgi:hypothetical protein